MNVRSRSGRSALSGARANQRPKPAEPSASPALSGQDPLTEALAGEATREEVVTIDKVGRRGDGLARQADPHNGHAILAVPYSLPGETIRARISGESGEVMAILTPSQDRQAPFCPHFGTCGGCALQHWHAEAAGAWKRERIARALARAGLLGLLDATLLAKTQIAHGEGRRRATFHIRQAPDGRIEAGFMRARSHSLLDIDTCPVLVPALAAAPNHARALGHILKGVPKPLDAAFTASESGLDVDLRGAGALPEALRQKLIAYALTADFARLTLHGELLVETRAPFITLAPQNLRAYLPPGSFLQATQAGEEALAALALTALQGAKHVADLFCGLGPFGLRLGRVHRVSGFDADAAAIAAFTRAINAHPGGKPIRAEARDLFRRPLLKAELAAFDAVLLDPPRQGAQAQVAQIARSNLEKLVYIACDPDSFARDAAVLVQAGFGLEQIVPVDQFRASTHIELFARFSR